MISALKNKKLIVTFVLVVTVGIIALSPMLAQSQDLGLEDARGIGLAEKNLKEVIVNIVQIILGFLGLIAVIVILYGGYFWVAALGGLD